MIVKSDSLIRLKKGLTRLHKISVNQSITANWKAKCHGDLRNNPSVHSQDTEKRKSHCLFEKYPFERNEVSSLPWTSLQPIHNQQLQRIKVKELNFCWWKKSLPVGCSKHTFDVIIHRFFENKTCTTPWGKSTEGSIPRLCAVFKKFLYNMSYKCYTTGREISDMLLA